MVRVDDLEMQLVSGGCPLPEVTAADGTRYAVAAPGQEFMVRVTLLRDPNPMPGIYHRIALQVDGLGTGRNERISHPGHADFKGFLVSGDSRSTTYRSFVFSKPKETAAKQATGLNFVEGSIKATVHLATESDVRSSGKGKGPAAANETVAALPEGKKFFMAPSLTTGMGKHQTTRSSLAPYRSRLLGGPIATLRLRYETAATLLLRGVLKPDNPTHRAILQQFPETAHKEEAGGDEAGPSGAAAGGGCKRQREQQQEQREQQQGQQQEQQRRRRRLQQQGDDDVIDLTKPLAGANDAVLAARRENKVLTCDLTEENEGPQWQAAKAAVHGVE